MASYIDAVLTSDERVMYKENISMWSQMLFFILGVILIPLFGLGLIFFLVAYINYKSTELAVTNKRVIAKFGFISRKTVEINIKKVESIQVNQGVVGRICNYGTLIISGAGNPQAPIPGISNPLGFRKAFMDIQEQAAKA
jgi:uncharacterized membrane protein YdbT with pleckstrin-like domain